MPLDYEIDSKLKALTPVIDEHAEWFCRATKRIFFPASFKNEEKLGAPESFRTWIRDSENHNFLEKVILDDLKKLFDELHIVARGLTEKTGYGAGEPVSLQEYDDFTSLYESFILKLRRLEYDCAMADSGLDIESGLRSRQAMKIDINRELERRSRRGGPFTLVLARIDDFENIKGRMDAGEYKALIDTLGRLIKRCIRSFDDAYRSDDNEFVMSLKQSVATGGTAAVNRLRSYLAEEKIALSLPDGKKPLTMSYCVAEPVPGDSWPDLLNNMRQDLDKWDEGGDAALEYHEKSPLQRFIGSTE